MLPDEDKTKEQLISELEGMRQRIAELEVSETECKQMEEALRESERGKVAILESMSELVVYQDTRNKILWANRAAAESAGLALEELTGRYCYEVWPHRSEPCIGCPVLRARESGQPQEAEITTPDGRVWFIRGYPIRDENGDIEAVVEVVLEITERKRVEGTLRESEYKFRVLFESTLDGLIVIDAETMKIVLANQAAARLYGFDSVEDAIGVNLLDFVIPDDRERALKITVEDMFEKDLRQVNEFLTLIREGREIWVSALGVRTEYQGRLAGLISFRDVTERKRAEELARSSLELQRTISAISARFVRLTDIDDAINKSLADIGRFSNASRAYLFLFHEDGTTADNTHEWCAEGVSRQIENNQNVPTEILWWMAHIRQGELVQIEDASQMPPEASAEKALLESQDIKSLLVSPAYDSQGKIIGLMGFDNAVSTGRWSDDACTILRMTSEIIGSAIQRQQMVEALREREAYIRTIVSNAPVVIWSLDKEGIFTLSDGAGLKALRLRPGEVVGQSVFDVYRDVPKILEDNRRALAGESFVSIVEVGELVFESHYSPIRDKNREVIGMVGVSTDITERKQVEETLRESEEFSSSLLENAPNPITVINPDTSIRYVNPALEKLTGFSSAELIGRKAPYPWWLEEDQQQYSRELEEVVRRGEYRRERFFQKKNGERFWVEITSIPVERDGELRHFLSIWIDITERKQAQEKEQQLQQELYLSSRLASIGELAAGVAHEINNPLTGIIGFSQLLLRKSTDEETSRNLEIIYNEAQRAAKVVGNLLTFARRREPKKEYSDIHDI